MQIVQAEFIDRTPVSYYEMVNLISSSARTCYGSRDRAGNLLEEEKFIAGLVKAGHESVIEHCNLSVELVLSRSDLAQLTRHRVASYSVQSQRYVKYDNVEFIQPVGLNEEQCAIWKAQCLSAEKAYKDLLDNGCPAETARAVLPNCTATRLVITANIREWRHIMKLRTHKMAQKDIRYLFQKLCMHFKVAYPCFFQDIKF